jgi:hypothetical protein
MSKTAKILIISAGPTGCEIAQIAKRLSKDSCVVSVSDATTAIENFNNQILGFGKAYSDGIMAFDKLAVAVNELEVLKKTQEFTEPKSKYINKPRNNYKKR